MESDSVGTVAAVSLRTSCALLRAEAGSIILQQPGIRALLTSKINQTMAMGRQPCASRRFSEVVWPFASAASVSIPSRGALAEAPATYKMLTRQSQHTSTSISMSSESVPKAKAFQQALQKAFQQRSKSVSKACQSVRKAFQKCSQAFPQVFSIAKAFQKHSKKRCNSTSKVVRKAFQSVPKAFHIWNTF